MSDEPNPNEPLKPPPALRITADELTGSEIDDRVRRMQEATAPALIQQVGTADQSKGNSFGMVGAMSLAGLVGGLLGWAAVELVTQQWRFEQEFARPWYGFNPTVGNMLFLGVFGVVLGVVISGWDAIATRSPAKFWTMVGRAAPLLLAAAVIGGWITTKVYVALLEGIIDDFQVDPSEMHLPRGIAWAMFGAAIGAAIGGASRSMRRTVNGAIGGAIGGFVGGFVFDFITISETNGIPNRIIGLTITGTIIGASIALVELARREHWIEIVSGGMAGKQFILHRDESTIGSAPTCDVTLIKDPALLPTHAVLRRTGDTLSVRAMDPAAAVQVNGAPVVEQALNDGDLVQLGSTVLRYRAKQGSMPTGTPLPARHPGYHPGYAGQPGPPTGVPGAAGPIPPTVQGGPTGPSSTPPPPPMK